MTVTARLLTSRNADAFGICNRINAYVAGECFARATCDPVYSKSWGISVFNVDGTVGEYEIPIGEDAAGAIDHVTSIINLSFRSNYAARVAA